jgi:hypothetical protein
MSRSRKDSIFEIQEVPIFGSYNRQRFTQWSPEDTANWYVAADEKSKKPMALYPCMGRSHISYSGINRLSFPSEPRGIFKTIDFCYVIEGNGIYQIDSNYNQVLLTPNIQTVSGNVYFTFLVVNNIVFACFVDSQKIYIYQEGTGSIQVVTDPNAPGNFTVNDNPTKPGFISAFGNRITVSVQGSSQFVLSAINLVGNGGTNPPGYNFDPNKCFTNFTTPQVFALENGIIRQMGVLNNTLYIFTDYTTGVWSNIQAVFSGTGVTFPWKKNSTYDWNFGIANSDSLDINFGILVFLARNSDGLLQFMMSNGGQPQRISTKSIDTLLQNYTNALGINNPFLLLNSNGFLYQYENTIFYRMSGGQYNGIQILDQEQNASSIEFSFETGEWHRCIEYNGERNRARFHVYFNFKHLITVIGDGTIYDMSGQYYYNEITNPNQSNHQAEDAYIAYPIRYERSTPIIYEFDYSEFETEYVQIDFVFGDSFLNYSTAPFINAQFLIDEQPGSDGQPKYMISELPDSDNQPVFILGNQGNTPGLTDTTYNYLYNPSIELFFSDDGGISFKTADVLSFSQMGVYSWRMRWYQLGSSRNRVYKLVCVSMVPIVILGSVMNVRRISGGAN